MANPHAIPIRSMPMHRSSRSLAQPTGLSQIAASHI